MGSIEQITSSDGHVFDAWVARPDGTPKGGVVVIQEIFGVNAHIREVTDRFAAAGFLAAAPALFDRREKGVELGYDADGITSGRGHVVGIGTDPQLRDVAATATWLHGEGGGMAKVGAVGYCWGGVLAFLAATRLGGLVDAASSFYGTRVTEFLYEKPRVPLEFHLGSKDHSLPPEAIDSIRTAFPASEVFVYDADHGFNCDHRQQFDAQASALAWPRVLAFFTSHLAP